jgi:uncharacterized protein (DUF2461 family)
MCHMYPGFAAAATAFFRELDADNSRAFWAEHRHRYDDLRPAFLALLAGLGGEWRVYRPHNDTRSARQPYKTFLGAVTEDADGVGAFVQVGPRGLLVGTGVPQPAADQLARLREAIGGGTSGPAFTAAVGAVEAAGGRVHGGRWDPLARVPRGWPADHPRAAWLRWKGVEVSHRPGSPAWLDTPDAPAQVRSCGSAARRCTAGSPRTSGPAPSPRRSGTAGGARPAAVTGPRPPNWRRRTPAEHPGHRLSSRSARCSARRGVLSPARGAQPGEGCSAPDALRRRHAAPGGRPAPSPRAAGPRSVTGRRHGSPPTPHRRNGATTSTG